MKRKILIVLAVSLGCFLIGGGWHFVAPGDDFVYGLFYRLDSVQAELNAWTMLFLFCGPAAGLAGAAITTFVFVVRNKRKGAQ